MPRKTKKDVFQPEVERQLPARQVVVPTLDELNRLMEHLLENERQRARREFFGILIGMLLVFMAILAGMGLFAYAVFRQLQIERAFSEKAREDILQLVRQERLMQRTSVENAVEGDTSLPRTAPEPTVVIKTGRGSADIVPAEKTVPVEDTASTPPAIVPRRYVEVHPAEDLTLRLPIPAP